MAENIKFDKKKKSLARRIIEAEQRNMPKNRADDAFGDDGILSTKEEFELLRKIRAGMYGDPMKLPKTFLNKLQQEERKQDKIGDDFADVINKEYYGKDPNELMRSRRFNIDPRAITPGMGGLTPGRGMAQYYEGELEYEGPYAGRGTLKRSFKKGGKVRGAGIARKGIRKCKMV
jgi:hypothetical protein